MFVTDIYFVKNHVILSCCKCSSKYTDHVSYYRRLYQLSKAGKLTVAAMNVNDSVTKVLNSIASNILLEHFTLWYLKFFLEECCC